MSKQRLETRIATLSAAIAALEAAIGPVLEQAGDGAAAATRLQPIPGISRLTAAWLRARPLNCTRGPRADAAAASAGRTANADQSGRSVQQRATIGQTGNRRLRTALYLATLRGTQHNPLRTAMYERLRAAGKPMKVARGAVARKLVRIAWAVVTKDQPFDPLYG